MIERLIAASLRFRLAIIASTLLVIAAGSWALAHIHVDAFPDLTPNQVQVLTEAPGLSPSEVENLVSYPMETAMMGLPRTQSVRSISKGGISVVTVSFEDDVETYFARAQVQQRMQDASGSLPAGFRPTLGPPATPMGEVFQYLVESDSVSLMELRNLHEYTIKPLLRTVAGVADVNSWGGLAQQFHVEADPAKLAGYNLSLSDLEHALVDNNANFGAGYLESRGERFTVRGLGRLTTVTDIGNVVAATHNGIPVYVRDIAQVAAGAMPREGAVSRDGRGETLAGMIVMLKGANGREVVSRVEDRLIQVRKLLPPGVSIRAFYNQGDVVDRTTHTLSRNLLEGGLLVTAVLFLFLRNVRASLITASVIPLSLLIAFVVMQQSGLSANLMSLGALDFGLLVDASLVMVENFVRRLERAGPVAAVDRRRLVQEAAFEVGRPIVFGVCIIIAVYLPIFSLQGIEGRMFAPMAFTVCVAVFGSLVLALTYVPTLSSLLLTQALHTPATWLSKTHEVYRRSLTWALAHRVVVVSIATVLTLAAIGSVPFLGTEFMPKLDEGSLMVETRRLPSASLPEGMRVAKEVERVLMPFPEVTSVVTKLGRPELATETMGLYAGDVYVNLKPREQWRERSPEALIVKMDAALKEIPGIDYNFTAPMAMRLDEAISGVRTELGVKVFGENLAVLGQKAGEIRDVIKGVPGAADVSVDVSAGAMQAEIALDRDALARYGLNVADVRDAVRTGIGGAQATEIIDGRKRFPVIVRLAQAYRTSPEAIGQLLITTTTGVKLALSQVAQVQIVEGPERITHENGQRMMIVQSNVRGRDLGGFAADVQRDVSRRLALPQGYFVTYSGQFENQQRATERLLIIVPLVLLLIAGFLYGTFGSVRQALLVMLDVPFALVGGVAALWLRGLNLNLSASVGFIALFGVAVLNGVVLIAYINQLRDSGKSLAEAVRDGADVRLRPVLMTALVASFGFIPMATSTSPGSEVQRPLATVVIGGLVTSTVLTLFVLPVLYEWVEQSWPLVAGFAARTLPGKFARAAVGSAVRDEGPNG
ncbi:MAG TPA: CusA/CzcA family heavy metal efflux RND transporter [Vicinamibacterales bacterium]|nr:CusA/CzcA family heavy metal efflux RND transporter [Vicinamibacterales bacterium]